MFKDLNLCDFTQEEINSLKTAFLMDRTCKIDVGREYLYFKSNKDINSIYDSRVSKSCLDIKGYKTGDKNISVKNLLIHLNLYRVVKTEDDSDNWHEQFIGLTNGYGATIEKGYTTHPYSLKIVETILVKMETESIDLYQSCSYVGIPDLLKALGFLFDLKES